MIISQKNIGTLIEEVLTVLFPRFYIIYRYFSLWRQDFFHFYDQVLDNLDLLDGVIRRRKIVILIHYDTLYILNSHRVEQHANKLQKKNNE